jgi:hypothetical protein
MTGQRAKFRVSANGRLALNSAQGILVSEGATGRARMMNLKEAVERYLSVAGDFGKPALLAAFGMERSETEALFGALDEDYHISRFLHFTCESGNPPYVVSGEEMTHVAIDAGVRELL